MKRILMIATDNERWGPARLPEPLSHAGVEVAVLCPTDNPLSQSTFVSHHYDLQKLKSWRTFGRSLGMVVADWKPDLIIPCDEIVVVMLHYFLKRPHLLSRYVDAGQVAVLRHSIGRIERLDAMVLKHQTRLLAESLGVPVPKSRLVKSPEQAENVAASMGFPVFLKASFSWAGQGAIRCDNAEQTHKTFRMLRKKTSWVKSMVRSTLARDWYPSESDIEVQQAIAGESVMYSVAALNGQMLGGLFASRAARTGANGPSTTVAIGEHPECRWMAEKLIAAMGASGFLAFDFMKCQNTNKMYLLECNPRPNQIFHLGHRVGSDLCKALVDGLYGRAQPARNSTRDAIVPLFPQTWLHDEQSALAQVNTLDVPLNDPKLLGHMLRCGQLKGHATRTLLDLLKKQGLVSANYTFG
jgi:Carbamoyl-phosphate synthase L chain, ATP binding domain